MSLSIVHSFESISSQSRPVSTVPNSLLQAASTDASALPAIMNTQSSPPGPSQAATPTLNKGQKRPQEDAAARNAHHPLWTTINPARRQKLKALYTLTPEEKAELERSLQEGERISRARTWEDLISDDRTTFEKRLRSKSSALYLESCPSYRAYCRATFCLPRMLSGRRNIESSYRFNLQDPRDLQQPNAYYHITCIEQVHDLPALVADMFAAPEYLHSEIRKINDWLQSGFKSIEGHSCQFSEVLTSVDEALQVDHLPSTLLRLLTKPLAKDELMSIISSDNLAYSKTADGQKSGKVEEPSESPDATPLQIPIQPTTPLQLTRTQFQVFLKSFLARGGGTKVMNVKVDSQTDDTPSDTTNFSGLSNSAVLETEEDVPVSSVVDANSPHAQNEPNAEIRIEDIPISKTAEADVDGAGKDPEVESVEDNIQGSNIDNIGRT